VSSRRRRALVVIILIVAIVVVLTVFFAVILFFLVIVVRLFSKEKTGSRRVWGKVFWVIFAHAQCYVLLLGKVIAYVIQEEAISFPIEGVGGSSISMLSV
jgi:heme/copper-type cytochrome/quinol oxidase subunit 1